MNYICSENFQWKKRIFDGKCSQFKDPALHETNLVAFLRGDPDPDQRSKICLDHVHQRNRWIYDQSRFTGSFDVSWSRQMDHWFGSWPPNHPDHPKTPHSKEMYSTWFGDDVIRFAPAVGAKSVSQLRCKVHHPIKLDSRLHYDRVLRTQLVYYIILIIEVVNSKKGLPSQKCTTKM